MNGDSKGSQTGNGPGFKGVLLRLMGVGLIVLLIVLAKHKPNPSSAADPAAKASQTSNASGSGDDHLTALERMQRQHKFSQETAAATVARRLALFSHKQKDLAHRLADHNKLVPTDVDRFFDALANGDWPLAQQIYKSLRDGDYNAQPKDPAMRPYWRALQEAYGAAEQAQLWPPQQFLAYGNSILSSLPAGMVYLGGTDAGCFICTMLNATSDSTPHITLTQNSLADPDYLNYLKSSNGDNINLPSTSDQQAAMAQYLKDAQSRYDHDQQHPDEPKQVQPGEDLSVTDGKVVINGVKAVMAVNSILVQDMVKANPGLSFGMEDSFPIGSAMPGSTPLGSIIALNGGGDAGNSLTEDGAKLAVNHWQDLAQSLATSPDTLNSSAALTSYAHDAAVQGDLLANNKFPTQAEQTYQSALAISPNCLDAVLGLAKVFASQGQTAQASQALNNFAANTPQQQTAIANFRTTYLTAK